MTTSIPSISDFLTITPPFNLLSTSAIEQLTQKAQLLRYRMGQTIVVKETMPAHVAIIYEGQARLIGYSYNSAVPDTIELLQPGAILGWVSLLRGVGCETAIASTEKYV